MFSPGEKINPKAINRIEIRGVGLGDKIKIKGEEKWFGGATTDNGVVNISYYDSLSERDHGTNRQTTDIDSCTLLNGENIELGR